MAKWGEGDPRWIVEERPDATNVNNWHWTEKNATSWSKDRLTQLLNGLKFEGDGIKCYVFKVDDCIGEATVNNRKGKLIFFYEWKVVLKWTGTLPDSDLGYRGKITIPNLSEENDIDDIEITITVDESNDESENLKQFMYNIGRDVVRKQLELYIKELKEEYSKNLILPKKGEENSVVMPKVNQPGSSTAAETSLVNSISAVTFNDSTTSNVGCKLDVKTLTMTVEFLCSANDLFKTLTNVDMLTAFTRAPAKIDARINGEFELYGGNVSGKFELLVPRRRIIQTWRLKNWPSGHFSQVVIDFEESKNSTQLKLTQTGIPASEFEAMFANWHRYYWQSIKQTFGFGSSISNIF